MSQLKMTKLTQPAAPAVDKVSTFIDTIDLRMKTIDANGVVSILNNDGLQDRNLLDNGSLMIQQRFVPASTAIPAISNSTRAGCVADRWAVTSPGAPNVNWQQVDASGTPETGLIARYYGSMIAAAGAGKKVMISQFLIASQMMHTRGLKVRFSIKHNQKVGTGQTYRMGIVQLQSAGTVDAPPTFLNGAWSTTTGVDPVWNTNTAVVTPESTPTPENGTLVGSYINVTSVAATWVRSSGVWTIPSTCKGFYVVFFSDATGGTTDNISVAEIQLTVGPDIVDFVQPPQGEELVRCLRFYCKSFPQGVTPNTSQSEATAGSGACGMIGKAAAAALAVNFEIRWPIVMWKVPTVTYFSPVVGGNQAYRFSGAAAAAQTATASRANSTTDRGVVVTATGDAAGTVGDLVGVHFVADAEVIA